jgi:hypothetical protein
LSFSLSLSSLLFSFYFLLSHFPFITLKTHGEGETESERDTDRERQRDEKRERSERSRESRSERVIDGTERGLDLREVCFSGQHGGSEQRTPAELKDTNFSEAE